MAWADLGACAGMDPELFHPVDDGGDAVSERASAACRRCPVIAECRDWALHHEAVGYWGGLTEKARRRLRRILGITDPAALGRDEVHDEVTGLTPPLSELDLGRSAREVAAAAGVSTRTVVRHRTARRNLA